MKNFFTKIRNALPKGASGIIFAVLILIGLVGGYFVYRTTSNFIAKMTIAQIQGAPIIDDVTSAPSTNQPGAEITPTPVSLDTFVMPKAWDGHSRVNLLIMGLDARSSNASMVLTDTMILFTLDPVSNTAAMISIPRDLWVKIPGGEYSKINTAYDLGIKWQYPGGGPALAAKTVENLLGVPVNYYAQIDFGTFVKFIDIIDGVKIDVPEEIMVDIVDTPDVAVLQPGIQTLPGDLALAYVRNRSTAGGDIDRAQRQQQVIMGIIDRITEFNMLPKLIQRAPQLYSELSSGVHTNLSIDQISRLAVKFFSDVPRENIQRYAINYDYVTMGTSPDGLSMLRPIPDKIRELRDQVFAGSALLDNSQQGSRISQEAARIRILNASAQSNLGERMANYLNSQGMQVVETANTSGQTYSSLTLYGSTPFALRHLVDFVSITPSSHIIYAYDPSAPVDIVLILGDDFANSNKLP